MLDPAPQIWILILFRVMAWAWILIYITKNFEFGCKKHWLQIPCL